MENKGLCGTCNVDKTCVFPRQFPVLQCEEFTDYTNSKHSVKARPKKARCTEEITEEE